MSEFSKTLVEVHMSTIEYTWNLLDSDFVIGVAYDTHVDDPYDTGNTGTQDWLPNRVERQSSGFYTYIVSPSPTALEDSEERFDALLAATSTQALRAALRNDD